MAKIYRNKVFWIIRSRVQKKHPDWSERKVFIATEYCFKKNIKGEKINEQN